MRAYRRSVERTLGCSSSFNGSMVGIAGGCSGGWPSTVGLTGLMSSMFTSSFSVIADDIEPFFKYCRR